MGLLSNIPVLGKLIDKGLDVVDQFVEDKDQANKIKAEIKKQIESQDHELAMAQIKGQLDVNKTEAQHKSIFVAGWRPSIGWVCSLGLAYQFLLYPLLVWIWTFGKAKGFVPVELNPPPTLDGDLLFSLIVGMLGMGGLRSFDKVKKVQTDKIK